MARMQVVRRHWTMLVPSTDEFDWVFEFDVKFVCDGEPLHIVVLWEEPTIGSGSYLVRDVGVTWGTLFHAWSRMNAMAYDVAETRNIAEAKKGQ